MHLPLATDQRTVQPIYDGTRTFLGRKDLVVSFYTQKCQFECNYCALPLRSANAPVSIADLNKQIDWVLAKHADKLSQYQQLSFGNEGSALDQKRFFKESMEYLLRAAKAMTALEVLSIETRPEYISLPVLESILAQTTVPKVDVTIGLETQDDAIRERLNKKMSKKLVEDRIEVLGKLGVRLTSYVMIKPAPGMTEEEGVADTLGTIEYLVTQCAKRSVDLVIYLTPTYIAEGSQQALTSKEIIVPPTIQSVLRVILSARKWGVPIYTGLWSEELAEEGNDFRGRRGYDPMIRKAILQFNRTNDISHLLPFEGLL